MAVAVDMAAGAGCELRRRKTIGDGQNWTGQGYGEEDKAPCFARELSGRDQMADHADMIDDQACERDADAAADDRRRIVDEVGRHPLLLGEQLGYQRKDDDGQTGLTSLRAIATLARQRGVAGCRATGRDPDRPDNDAQRQEDATIHPVGEPTQRKGGDTGEQYGTEALQASDLRVAEMQNPPSTAARAG